VAREGGSGGFCATAIGGRDWGVIDLDPSGKFKIFFQFVTLDEAPQFFTKPVLIAGGAGYVLSSVALSVLWLLKGEALDEAIVRGLGIAAIAMIVGGLAWSLIRQEGESQASLAFSVVLHAALLFMTYQLYDGENPFVWPGPRQLAGSYLVTKLEHEEPPEPKKTPTVGQASQEAAAAATKEPPKKTATKGEIGTAGGKGETERARDANAKDVPPEAPKVQFFEDKNKKVLDNIIDRNLSTSLTKFAGIQGDTTKKGSLGFGNGTGTGVGLGTGTGTRSGTKGKGNGGGGNAEGDFVTGPGKIDTGGERPGGGNCKGAGCGTGPKPVQVAFSNPSGDFGGLTSEEIDRVVKARAGVFRACYQKELNHTPGIGGKLIIHFKIGGDGVVQAGNTATSGGSTLHNDGVESCIKSNVNRLKFPAKGGVANVNYPFVFTQGG
ncbi:MAG TPA: AgmX/PglI C-terminal domain-containing protein, partial [Kofleriaceae bacterium]